MTQSIGSFFGGGGKGITWPETPGKSVTGTITAIHAPEPVNDPKTGQPDSSGRMQIRIELETDERDPEVEFDDGGRTLYVKSYMRGAIGDALRKAGEKEPKVGGKLTVTFTHTEPPERPGLSASKHFSAVYEPPSATGGFFGSNGSGTASATAEPVKPAAISDAAWSAMDASTRAAVAATMSTMATNEPPF